MYEYKATARFFTAWYKDQRTYSMHKEDWLFVLALIWASLIAFGVGLLIGLVWAAML